MLGLPAFIVSLCRKWIGFGSDIAKLQQISGITSKNGRNDAKRLNINVVTVSNDAKPKMLKKQRKAEYSRRTVCKSLPDEK